MCAALVALEGMNFLDAMTFQAGWQVEFPVIARIIFAELVKQQVQIYIVFVFFHVMFHLGLIRFSFKYYANVMQFHGKMFSTKTCLSHFFIWRNMYTSSHHCLSICWNNHTLLLGLAYSILFLPIMNNYFHTQPWFATWNRFRVSHTWARTCWVHWTRSTWGIAFKFCNRSVFTLIL